MLTLVLSVLALIAGMLIIIRLKTGGATVNQEPPEMPVNAPKTDPYLEKLFEQRRQARANCGREPRFKYPEKVIDGFYYLTPDNEYIKVHIENTESIEFPYFRVRGSYVFDKTSYYRDKGIVHYSELYRFENGKKEPFLSKLSEEFLNFNPFS